MRRAVEIHVTMPMLKELLRLPDGAVLTDARVDFMTGHVCLTAESPDLPELHIAVPPTATPKYRKNYEKTEPAVEFIEWGIR